MLWADGFVWLEKCVLFIWIRVPAGGCSQFVIDFTSVAILTQLIGVTCLVAED